MTVYRDRAEAGRALADRLTALIGEPGVVVLGLVRGGVPVARVVAERLGVPLDVLVVRKLGMPMAPEVAFGALGPGGVRVLNDTVARQVDSADIAEVQHREQAELDRRERIYRAGRPRWTSPTASPSSSTTDWPPERPPARPSRSPANSVPAASWSPSRSAPSRRTRCSPPTPTR
ncbi:hypothetical protein Jiend_28850 [Micromonospora endophytica]|nr:hypothetical protein Jiend_28850 [Micromonospora endophytica]